jgi:hypothetical protein
MMLGFFKRRKTETVGDVIAQKDYERALAMIRAELVDQPGDRRLRLQLADVLLLAGQQDEAVGRLEVLADELAAAGFASQSIAILRRIKSLTPLRGTVDDKLNHLLHPGLRRPNPRAKAEPPPRPRGPVGLPAGVPIGAQRLPDPDEIPPLPLESSEPLAPGIHAESGPPWTATAPGAPAFPDDPPSPPAPATPPAFHVELYDEESPFFFDASSGTALAPGGDFDDAEIEISVEEELEEYVRAAPPAKTGAPPPAEVESAPAPALPRIFSEVAAAVRDELLATLPREAREAGEIVLSEGEAAHSIYVIQHGVVRVYVKARDGRDGFLRALSAGEVFGEIGVLTRKKQTATVVAAADCALLRIDKETLDRVVTAHPEVQAALYACFDERANDPAEAVIRGKKSRRSIPGRRKPPAPRARRAPTKKRA